MTTPAGMAAPWGGTVTRMVTERENRVYEMALPSGERAALRLHRVEYQTGQAIEDELKWTEALAQQGFPCPRPVPTLSGDLVVETPDGLVTAVTWVDAEPLADRFDAGTPLAPELRRLGALLARLHTLTDASGLTLNRHAWNRDGLTGPDPLWGRYWENPALRDAEAQALVAARDTARDYLSGQAGLDEGLIHADAIAENVLCTDRDMWLIDFDDSGTGYRLYDLGVALVQFWQHADFADLVSSIAEGYAGERGCDAAPLVADIPKFTAMRGLSSAGWLIARAGPEDPRHRRYVDRALGLARRYL
ncbi:Homoserine kinase [Candidatus Rhodobacter oscarellae]|uniref:Homoserine kinase n=1 Tax=Candidatus Rhodobacter oscarellae TaxID=1675527 RepID=A0A0J9E8E7_9RHOB|nr:phosphotransferase [Candidatus Rhodobacter lobularis]KMW58996.1 Homoserine kinase [Candidatus Rhodobacter lobularis]